MKKICIVIPAYNEEKRIGKTLESYSKHFLDLMKKVHLNFRILVVINNTKDRTEEIVKGYKKRHREIDYLNLKKGGKGYAVVEGFKKALKDDFDIIGFVDADMATPPQEYWKLIENLNNCDGVIADRYKRSSKIYPKPTMKRLIARKVFNIFARSILLLSFEDTQCGAKVFKRFPLESVISDLTMSQWAFDVDLLYSLKKKGFKIKSSPTIWTDKEYSKINFWKAGPWMALAIARLRLIHSPFKSFVRIYDKLLKFVPR